MKASLTIQFKWTFRGPLHMGTGMSRIGDADRLIRRSADDLPCIDGEQVKGAIRGAAERLLRWLGATETSRAATDSIPVHPVLLRLFAPSRVSAERLLCFDGAVMDKSRADEKVASTAIGTVTGAALDHTLRVIEALGRGASFRGCIRGYGDWQDEASQPDLEFLCAALLAADAVGGRKGCGFGLAECLIIKAEAGNSSIDWPSLATVAGVQRLKKHVALVEVAQ